MTAPFDLATIAQSLTFAEAIEPLKSALSQRSVVVQAPPGSGKTTVVPPLVANELAKHDDPVTGRVIVTGPRRVVVRAAATRLAQLTNTRVGDLVGYRVRGDSRTSERTIVEFVTPGVLIRQVLADPELTGISAVILDEVHERGLDSDLLVGMLGDVRELRDDLTLVAMSATLDADRFAKLLGTENSPAPLVDSPSALFGMDVRWAPATTPRLTDHGVRREFLDHIAQVTARTHTQLLRTTPEADALVFVPGAHEVDHVVRTLTDLLPGHEVLALHGQLEPGAQDRAISGRSGDAPRVIVSTSLAESSLTVPGVRLVIDSGLAREPRRDVARGMSGLVTVSASRASAQQRAGRSARQGPGTVVRCYDEATYQRMPEHVTPEIATADLTGAALTLAAWGTPRGQGLRLPTAPPAAAMDAATVALKRLGALDDAEHLTTLGQSLVQIPAPAPLARALIVGAGVVGVQRAAEVVAALADSPRVPDADLGRYLRGLRAQPTANPMWKREVGRLTAIAQRHCAAPGSANYETLDRSLEPGSVSTQFADAFVAALAFGERLARRVSPGVYLTAGGTRAGLPPESPLNDDEWLVIADVARTSSPFAQGTGAVIRSAFAATRELAQQAGAHLLVNEVRAEWNTSTSKLSARQVHALGAIEFSSTPTKPTPQAGRLAVEKALREHGLNLLTFSPEADALRRRMAFAHHHLADPWPDVGDHALLERLDEWLTPELDKLAGGAKASSIALAEPLRRLLPWPEATRFDELAPERLEVPSGSRIRLQYPEVDSPGEPVIVPVKLQECFGLAETPRLADGKSPVLFHLLSPAGRPLAITDDLASFWSGPYAGVRADMRGRYPKHPWPEDPWNHLATAKTKKRM